MIHGDYSWPNIFEKADDSAWELETVLGDWGNWNAAKPMASQLCSYSGTGPWLSPSVLCHLANPDSKPLHRTILHECDSNLLGLLYGFASFAGAHGGDGRAWCRGRENQTWADYFHDKHNLIVKPREHTFQTRLPDLTDSLTKAQTVKVGEFIGCLYNLQRILFGEFVDELGTPLPTPEFYKSLDALRARKSDETARRYFKALDAFCSSKLQGLHQLKVCLELDLAVRELYLF